MSAYENYANTFLRNQIKDLEQSRAARGLTINPLQQTVQRLFDRNQNSLPGLPSAPELGSDDGGAFDVVNRYAQMKTANTPPAFDQPAPPARGTENAAHAGPSVGVSGNIQAIVNRIAEQYGWNSGAEWAALVDLVQRESSWNPQADNPTSTAYGLFQFLDSTWAGTGIGRTSDPVQQAIAGLRYIQSRYGSPSAAIAFHNSHNWY